jgi:hypothetical protein
MFWPITGAESYVQEIGKSMKGAELANPKRIVDVKSSRGALKESKLSTAVGGPGRSSRTIAGTSSGLESSLPAGKLCQGLASQIAAPFRLGFRCFRRVLKPRDSSKSLRLAHSLATFVGSQSSFIWYLGIWVPLKGRLNSEDLRYR